MSSTTNISASLSAIPQIRDEIASVSAQNWATVPKSIVVTPTFNTNSWVEDLGTAQKLYWMAIW